MHSIGSKFESLAGIGTWQFNIRENSLNWSELMFDIHELNKEAELTHETAISFYPEEEKKRVRSALKSLLDTGSAYDFEASIITAMGNRRWVRIASAAEQEHGEIVRIFGTVQDITDRIQAEKSLRYREVMLSGMFELSHIGIALNDMETGQFLEGNAALLEPTGYSREEFSRLSYWDLTPEQYASLEAQALEDLRQNGRYSIEKEYQRKDGTRYPVSLNGLRIEDPTGRPMIWSFIEDISERRAFEDALCRERDQFRQLLETSPSAIVMLDIEGRIIFANSEAKSVLGLEPSTLEGVSYNAPEWAIESVDGGTFPDSELPFVQVMASGAPVRNIMHAIAWPDGRRRILSINASPVTGSAGIESVICVVSDVTELVQSRERLRVSEERLRQATHAAKIGIWSYRPTSDRVYFSRECFEIMGFATYTPEMSGADYRARIHPDDVDRVLQALYACISGKRDAYREQIRHLASDGGYIWTLATGRIAERYDDGRTRVITGTFQDISGEKEFERLIAEGRDAAQRANKAKTDFIANTSHEIRTPLNGVLGMAKLLSMSELTEQQRYYVDTLCRSGQALLSLIENILDISLIEAGEIEFDIEPFDLKLVAETAIGIVAGPAIQKGLELKLDLDSSIKTMRIGDMRRLRQVLINLLGNAVKFAQKGEVALRITHGDGAAVHFEVTDTGPGLKREELDLIFLRFAQADSSNTRKHEGSGLGLAISKELVELAGGEISVESRFGQGATFRFTWPLPEAGVEPSVTLKSARAGKAVMRPSAHRHPVLVIDDNPTNTRVLEGALRSAGYEVLLASNGHDALEIMRTHEVALVLMDLHMPGMSGEIAISHIRAMAPPVCKTPILTVSADASAETAARLKRAAIQGSFSKPLDLDGLLDEIHIWTHPGRKVS
jgi:two-component system sensor histidine kinase/response regulator